MKKTLQQLAAVGIVIMLCLVALSTSYANHGSLLHNATEQNAGNWQGSRATISWTNPNLRTGQWVYNRTSTNHFNTGTCFRFSENGWIKKTTGIKGLVVWDSGCNRLELQYTITAAQHTYSQQYYLSGTQDRYNWYVDETLS